MPASAIDKFKKVAPNTGWQIGGGGVADASVTTIPLVSSTSLPTGTGVILTVDRVDSSGAQTPTKMERVAGVISGTNLISCVRGIGGTAQPHSAGAVVEIVIDSVLWNDLMDGILVEHDQLGAHKISSTIGTGWFPVPAVLTYSSADSPTFVATTSIDLTPYISVGMKIKLNQTTDKFFFVTAITSTTITLYGGTDYTLATATITTPYFSIQKAPFGFPLNPAKWTVTTTDTSDRSQSSPTAGTWYNISQLNTNIPIGAWRVSLFGILSGGNTTVAFDAYVTLSTANNSQIDETMTSMWYNSIAVNNLENFYRERTLMLAAKTAYYVNIKAPTVNTISIGLRGDLAISVLRCVCAYL